MPADAEATLPALIEAVQAADHADRDARVRGARRAAAPTQPRSSARRRRSRRRRRAGTPARSARRGCRPSSGTRSRTRTGRSCRTRRSSATGRTGCGTSTKHYQYIGWSGADGVGYGAPAAVGAALANRKHGRLTRQHPERRRSELRARRAVDGGASPHSAAHRHAQQPRLPPGADARAAHGGARNRGVVARRHRQRRSTDPNIDYAKMAKAWACTARPIDNPNDLGPALKRALEVVKRGEPALVDVVTQPR